MHRRTNVGGRLDIKQPPRYSAKFTFAPSILPAGATGGKVKSVSNMGAGEGGWGECLLRRRSRLKSRLQPGLAPPQRLLAKLTQCCFEAFIFNLLSGIRNVA